jgi:hypothetical protein
MQSNGPSRLLKNEVHQESGISKSFPASALAVTPEEKRKEYFTSRNSIAPGSEPESRAGQAGLTSGNIIAADRVPPRWMGPLDPRRIYAQSEPLAEIGCRQVEGTEEENEVSSGSNGTGKSDDVRKRTASAPLATTGGPESVTTNGSQGYNKIASNDIKIRSHEGLASPWIKAHAKTAANDI